MDGFEARFVVLEYSIWAGDFRGSDASIPARGDERQQMGEINRLKLKETNGDRDGNSG